MKVKKIIALTLGICLLCPSVVYASNDSISAVNETSKLKKMTDTCLGDIIQTEDQVVINETMPIVETAAKDVGEESDVLKDIIEKYNKDVFLAIIGQDVRVDASISNDQDLIDEMNARNKYLNQNYGGGTTFTSYHFDLKYDDISIQNDLAKVVITRKITFQTSFEDKNVPVDADLAQKEGYIFKKENGEWKLLNVIFNSEGIPNEFIDTLLNNNSSEDWEKEFSFENLKRDQYEDTITFTEMLNDEGDIVLSDLVTPSIEYSSAYSNPSLLNDTARSAYSKAACETYAIKYGYHRNLNYRYFDADCTNFVSQAIHAGGLQMDSNWYYNNDYSYSRSWTVVDDLRNYIMNHTLSTGHYESLPDYPAGVGENGTLIQYSNGTTWKHSAIIRDINVNGIYVAEHTGPAGDTSYGLHGTDLRNKRTFWIGRG